MTTQLYSIDYFNTERGRGMGQYGCHIVLAREAITAILAIGERPKGEQLTTSLMERVSKSIRHAQPRFHFWQNTWMLTSFQIGGQCACLGIDGGHLDRLGESNVRYTPHNIDSPEHAAVLVSTWLLWFNSVAAVADIHQVFAM